ncbi:MerR family transcriptional regulator [Nocardia salmonicida]|uniref:MerR family transcriptional regulator n=1 Tax=Nocardia TaxID=1817 RepID=UPI0010425991
MRRRSSPRPARSHDHRPQRNRRPAHDQNPRRRTRHRTGLTAKQDTDDHPTSTSASSAGLTTTSEDFSRAQVWISRRKQGLLVGTRSPRGQRCYDDDRVHRVALVQTFLAVGMSSRTIAEMIPCMAEPTLNRAGKP